MDNSMPRTAHGGDGNTVDDISFAIQSGEVRMTILSTLPKTQKCGAAVESEASELHENWNACTLMPTWNAIPAGERYLPLVTFARV